MKYLQRQSEKKTERYLFERIKALNGLCIKLVAQHFNGLPDRLCILPEATVFFVETKSQGDDPRLIQKIVHDKIRNLGIKVHVCDTKEKVDTLLNSYSKYIDYVKTHRPT